MFKHSPWLCLAKPSADQRHFCPWGWRGGQLRAIVGEPGLRKGARLARGKNENVLQVFCFCQDWTRLPCLTVVIEMFWQDKKILFQNIFSPSPYTAMITAASFGIVSNISAKYLVRVDKDKLAIQDKRVIYNNGVRFSVARDDIVSITCRQVCLRYIQSISIAFR